MIRAFGTAIAAEVAALFLCSAIIAGVTEKMSVRAAGNGLMIFAGITVIAIGLSARLFWRLGAAWGGGKAVSAWALILYCLAALSAGVVMLAAMVVLLNR